ncbi:MAG: hypothetical protein KME26_16265 [Oscillatoria princeps RMCB-10]|nr:hypothetical protein [Oscillatoria princeps RMCB-10]
MARLSLWQVACMLAGAVAGSILSCDFSASSPTPPNIQDSPAPVGRNFQPQHDLTDKLSAGGKGVEVLATGIGGAVAGQSPAGIWPPRKGESRLADIVSGNAGKAVRALTFGPAQ